MKKVFGILNACIVLLEFIGLSYLVFSHKISWTYYFIGILILYILTQFLIYTRAGFVDKYSWSQISNKVVTITSVLFFCIASFFFITDKIKESKNRELSQKIEKQKKENRLYQELIVKNAETPKVFESQSTAYGINTELTTRVVDGMVEYIFQADFQKERPKIESFNIYLLDSMGFNNFEFSIRDLTTLLDAGECVGYKARGKISCPNLSRYLNSTEYSAAVIREN